MGEVRERFEAAIWSSDAAFTLGGAAFGLVDVGAPRAQPPALSLKKPRDLLETYVRVLDGGRWRQVLELGLNHGGSAAFFTALLAPERLVSIDVSGPVRRFDEFRASHPLGRRITARYQTSQADAAALDRILAEDLPGPLDLVLDDASHDYELTRASFEILFPRIRPGGCYALEDWQWAHAPGFWDRTDRPALSNLLFQVLMLAAGRPDLVAKVEVYQGTAFIWRGDAPAGPERLDLDALCFMQGRSFQLL
jgi:SAM-dependent methyltransferase